MKQLTALLLLCCITHASAQQFQLKTTNGKLSAPLTLKEGATTKVGNTDLTVINIKTHEDIVINKMQNIIIPHANLRQASLPDAIEFLRNASVENSADLKGINFAILPMEKENTSTAVSDQWGTNAPPQKTKSSNITINANDTPLLEILDVLMKMEKLKYKIRNNIVVIMPENAPDSEIVHKSYGISASAYYIWEDTSCRHDNSPGDFRALNIAEQYSEYSELEQFFSNFGVTWPIGSSIKDFRYMGNLLVANTAENHKLIKNILIETRAFPYQVEIGLNFVSYELSEISKLGPDGINTESLKTLWANGQGTLLAAPQVVTQSGQPATVKGCTEYIYPTEFTLIESNNTNSYTSSVIPAAEPGSFETREVGVILEVLPEVSRNGSFINLTLCPELVDPPIWEEYGFIIKDGNGQDQQIHMPQPFFHSHSLQSNIILENGHTILLGGGMPSSDRKSIVYIFITARLLGTKGQPLYTE